MHTRNTVILLASMLLMPNFASCGKNNEQTDTKVPVVSETSAPVNTADPNSVCDLPMKNWGGREYRILSEEDPTYDFFSNFEFISDGENGDVLNDSIYKRNSSVEEKYNVKITQIPVADTKIELNRAVLAGDDLYDIAAINLGDIGSLAAGGMLTDFNSINNINLDKNYYSQTVRDSLTVGGKLYFAASDFLLRDKSRTYFLYENRDLAESYNLGSFVELVRSNQWTMDKMTEFSKVVANDINNDGVMTGDDIWGLGLASYESFSLFTSAQGNRVITGDKNGDLSLTMNTEHMIDSIDKAISLTCDKSSAFFCNDMKGKTDYDYWYASSNIFKAGNMLFTTGMPYGLKTISADTTFDYGILPWPKFDTNQKDYYTTADSHSMLFGIPVSCGDTDFAGYMLEIMSYESSVTTLPAYYEISCKTKYTYDEDSAEMLDLVFSNIIYDFSAVYDIGGLNKILTVDIPSSKSNIFSSKYASLESGAKTALDKLVSDFENVD